MTTAIRLSIPAAILKPRNAAAAVGLCILKIGHSAIATPT